MQKEGKRSEGKGEAGREGMEGRKGRGKGRGRLSGFAPTANILPKPLYATSVVHAKMIGTMSSMHRTVRIHYFQFLTKPEMSLINGISPTTSSLK